MFDSDKLPAGNVFRIKAVYEFIPAKIVSSSAEKEQAQVWAGNSLAFKAIF